VRTLDAAVRTSAHVLQLGKASLLSYHLCYGIICCYRLRIAAMRALARRTTAVRRAGQRSFTDASAAPLGGGESDAKAPAAHSHSGTHHHHAHAHAGDGGVEGSFINRVKTLGANAMLGAFQATARFDATMRGLEVTRVAPGVVEARLTVHAGIANVFGTLHGGATATLVDVVGTMALLSLDVTRPGVTVELGSSYATSAAIGETVHVVGRVLKSGKRLGFTQVDITRARDGALVASGRHTKAFQA
jgi:acyl-coenzyme A thioesterase 13